MRVTLKFRDRIAAIGHSLLDELEQVTAAITAGWAVEHHLDGTHSDVTADSFTGPLTGNVTGNADTVTNGVYTTGNQTIAGVKTFTSAPIGVTPTTANELATKSYVDLAVSSLKLDEFFSSTADALGGLYYRMDTVQAGAGTVVSATISSSTTTNIFNFITASSEPHLDRLVAGVYDIHGHLKKTESGGSARTVTCYAELYSRTAGGVETLRGTSSTSSALTTSDAFYDLYLTLATEVTLDVTDRLLLKWYAVTTGGTANTTVTMTVGGTADPHFTVDVSATELDQIFVPYTGATHDVDLGAKNVATTGSLGVTGSRLTKGWFTDLEVTNAITGSVTGNAGTVTNGVYTTGTQSIAGQKTFTDDVLQTSKHLQIPGSNMGTANFGGLLEAGRNTGGTYKAAGCVVLFDRNGGSWFLWVDATGDLRIHSAGPTSDVDASDVAGTIVGTQS